jgi:hypothetical protein
MNARTPEQAGVGVLVDLAALRRGADDPVRIDACDATTGPPQAVCPGDTTGQTATVDTPGDGSETDCFCGHGCTDAFASGPDRCAVKTDEPGGTGDA